MPKSWKSLTEALETGRGIERPFNCPEHEDSRASASVNVELGVWYCYACGAKGNTKSGKHDKSYLRLLEPEAEIPELPPLAVDFTNAYYGYGPYWAERFGVDVAREFNTGIDPVTGLPCVPIHNPAGTKVHGFLQRTLADHPDLPKYLYPSRVPVSRLLFGYHLLPSTLRLLVLVEGASDVMALYSHLGTPKGCGAVAVYGCGLHAPQARLVNRIRPVKVLVAMDADDAGLRGAARSADFLNELGVPSMTYDWSELDVTDPGELEEDPWQSLMAAAYPRG